MNCPWVYSDNRVLLRENIFQECEKDHVAVFTTCRIIDARIECFYAHRERLKKSCHTLGIPFPEIDKDALFELIEKNNAFLGLFRMRIVVAFRDDTKKSHLFIELFSYTERKSPIRYSFIEYTEGRFSRKIKFFGDPQRAFFIEEAKKRNVDELVLVTKEGIVLETTTGNIFWEEDGVFFTPDISLPLLYGIMLQNIQAVLESLGKKLHFVQIAKEALIEKELYMTNSLVHYKPLAFLQGPLFLRNIEKERILSSGIEHRIAQNSLYYRR